MNPRLSIWYGCDPLEEDCPNTTSYCYAFNNPLKYIDLTGQENLVVVGSQNNDNPGSKLMFVNQGIRAIKEMYEKYPDESRTMLLFACGYTDEQIKEIGNALNKYDAELKIINSSDVLINYINNKSLYSSGNYRASDLITNMEIYSHGLIESIEFGYGTVCSNKYRLDIRNVSKISPDAFRGVNSRIYSYACKTGLGRNNNIISGDYPNSLAQKMANATEAYVFAYAVRTDYSKTLGTWSDRRYNYPRPAPIMKTVSGAVLTPYGASYPVKAGRTPYLTTKSLKQFFPQK